MKARKKQQKKPTSLPQDFVRTVTDLFNKQFKKEKGDAEFLVYGDLYMDEVVFCVSLSEAKSLNAATMYTSMDLPKGVADKPEQVTEKLKRMVDITASWFGQSFAEFKDKGLDGILEAMREQPDLWQEITWEKEKLYVRLNRENRALENAADRFLQEKGFDPDSDEFLVEEGEADEDDDSGSPSFH